MKGMNDSQRIALSWTLLVRACPLKLEIRG